MRVVIVFLFLMVSFGCASVDGPLYSETNVEVDPEKSKLIVYRAWSGTGAVHTAPFFVDGELVADLPNSTFSIVEAEPGARVVSYGSKKNPVFRQVKIDMKKGENYYVKLTRGFPDDFSLVSEQEAKQELVGNGYKYHPLGPL